MAVGGEAVLESESIQHARSAPEFLGSRLVPHRVLTAKVTAPPTAPELAGRERIVPTSHSARRRSRGEPMHGRLGQVGGNRADQPPVAEPVAHRHHVGEVHAIVRNGVVCG